MKVDRKPAVAGKFYSENPEQLYNEINIFFKNAKPRQNNTLAVISPHAGYVFSGQICASAINQINPNKKYENIFLIGTSHIKSINGAAVYIAGDYIIPGASIKVNSDLGKILTEENSFFVIDDEAHKKEHSLETQLPFLYHHLKNDFQIVPIIIGTSDTNIIKKIAEVLKKYFNEKNLFVISTDFSHYPNYKDAKNIDSVTAESILLNNSKAFINQLNTNENLNIPKLATSICGWSSVLALLYITENKKDINYNLIEYQNSGDVKYGDKNGVVGYFAISISKKNNFSLDEKDKNILLRLARETLINSLNNIKTSTNFDFSETLKTKTGAFVTLKNNGKLRGCVGQFLPNIPLFKVVQEMSVSAAKYDTRFSPVTIDELYEIEIEISVLSPLQKISDISKIEIGKDGIYIIKNGKSGTLLPQVAVEQNWNSMQFVEYCSQYKTGIGKDGWKNAELFIYQAIVFCE